MERRSLMEEAEELDDGEVDEAIIENDGDLPCPVCGEIPDAVVPCHGISINQDADDGHVCILPGGIFGWPGIIIFDHDGIHTDSDNARHHAVGGMDDPVDIDIEEL